MKHLRKFNESLKKEIIYTQKNNRNHIIKIEVTNGRISSIINDRKLRFPFSLGQMFNRGIETWACNNNFLVDGKDLCPKKKVFGINQKDIPQGHELRLMFPNKFD